MKGNVKTDFKKSGQGKLILKYFFLLFFGSLLSFNLLGLDLKEAKEQGWVGERKDGFVGYVTDAPNAELKSVIDEVNQKRKNIFKETATNTGATAEQVATRFYERAIEATKPNHYYQDLSGKWVKK